MKVDRQATIVRLIREQRLASQDELRAALAAEGIHATQATLSRDIRELGLVKLTDARGSYYAASQEQPRRPPLGQILPALLVGQDGVGPLLVLRTTTGGAGALTAALDQAGWDEIIGTIAGDDTVLVIARSQRLREAVGERIKALARR